MKKNSITFHHISVRLLEYDNILKTNDLGISLWITNRRKILFDFLSEHRNLTNLF